MRPILFLTILLIITLYPDLSSQNTDQPAAASNSNLETEENVDEDELNKRIDQLTKRMDEITDKKVKFGLSIGYRKLYSNQLDDFQSVSIDPDSNLLRIEFLNDDAFVLSTSVMVYPFLNDQKLKESIKINQGLMGKYRDTWLNENLEEINSIKAELRKNGKKDLGKDEYRKKKKEIKALNFKKDRLGLSLKNLILKFVRNIGFAANIDIAEFNRSQNEFLFNKNLEGGLGFSLRLNENIHVSFNNDLLFSRQLRQHIKDRVGKRLFIDGKIVTSNSELDPEDDNIFITKTVIARATRLVITF